MGNKTQPLVKFISPHFGAFPSWINLTFETFSRNRDFELLVVTDQKTEEFSTYSNIYFYSCSLEEFSNLVAQKTQRNVNIKRGYKICDFRPAFGVIFDLYLQDYDYWGHLDLDTFWGDMSSALNPLIAKKYDIIYGAYYHVGGPFCLYKNTDKINNLYQKNPFYIHAFEVEENVDFDEIGIQIDNQGFEKTVRISEANKEIEVFRGRQFYLQDLDSSWWIKQVQKAFPNDTSSYPVFEFGKGIWKNGKVLACQEEKEYMFYHFYDGKKRFFRPLKIKWCDQIKDFSIGMNGIELNYQSWIYRSLHNIEKMIIEALRIVIYKLGPLRHKLGLHRRK